MMTPSQRTAVVIGGGLAGIAAAVRLASAGVEVTLVETRKRLGGRATSFVDPATGQVLDNCQHVLLGCCTNLLDLYGRLGVADLIEWHRRLYFIDRRGTLDVMEAGPLPAPMHMSGSMLGFKSLTLGEKVAIARGMLALMRLGASGRARWSERSFEQWLIEQRQPPGAMRKFWGNIAISACNELPSRLGASYAMQVFQEGFLANAGSYVMGLSKVPLVRLYDAAEQVLRQNGGQVLTGRSAEALLVEGGRVTGLQLDESQRLTADVYVSALPADRLAKVVPSSLREADPRLAGLDQFEPSPIIGIHLSFSTEHGDVMTLPHAVFSEHELQWVFNKGRDEQGGQHLHGVISAAHDLVDEPAQKIIDIAVREIGEVMPAAKQARLLHARVVKEKRATFSARPGLDRHRPDPRGATANLYLAGDWCNTGWPATMEGAVRSGYAAAAAVLQDAGQPATPALVADLPHARMYRFIAGR
jgi:zeta-carotene desaturase